MCKLARCASHLPLGAPEVRLHCECFWRFDQRKLLGMEEVEVARELKLKVKTWRQEVSELPVESFMGLSVGALSVRVKEKPGNSGTVRISYAVTLCSVDRR